MSSWLFALARHKAIDLVRKEANVRKRTADVDLEFREADDDVDQEAWLRVRRDAVRAAITQLPETQRTALELAFLPDSPTSRSPNSSASRWARRRRGFAPPSCGSVTSWVRAYRRPTPERHLRITEPSAS